MKERESSVEKKGKKIFDGGSNRQFLHICRMSVLDSWIFSFIFYFLFFVLWAIIVGHNGKWNENVCPIPYSSGILQPNFISPPPPPSDITFPCGREGKSRYSINTRLSPCLPSTSVRPFLWLRTSKEGKKARRRFLVRLPPILYIRKTFTWIFLKVGFYVSVLIS